MVIFLVWGWDRVCFVGFEFFVGVKVGSLKIFLRVSLDVRLREGMRVKGCLIFRGCFFFDYRELNGVICKGFY